MDGKFTIEIEMGNDAMRRHSHVAAALHQVAKTVHVHGLLVHGCDGKILDANGNTVGRWEYKRED